MSDRDQVLEPGMYLGISTILGDLLGDLALRSIAQTTRETMQVSLAAISFRTPDFSLRTSLFVRDTLIAPMDFALCALTTGDAGVLTVPRLGAGRHRSHGAMKLRSYAGCAVLDRQRNCIGVFYMMHTKPRPLTLLETSRVRFYAHLVSSRIEIARRFGTDGSGPSPRQLVLLADRLASAKRDSEAQDLIALAYAAHDIASIRRRAPDLMPS